MTTEPNAANAEPDIHTVHLWQRPGYLVRRLNQIHQALFAECCGDYSITPVQYGVLTTLNEQAGIDQTSLCAALGIDRTTMTDVLRRLEQRGLVKRVPSLLDRRQKVTRLTLKGKKLTREMYGHMREAQQRLLMPLPPASREQFIQMMTVLVEGNNEFGRTSVKRFE